MHEMLCSSLSRRLQLHIIHVDRDHSCPSKCSSRDSATTYAATTKDRYYTLRRYTAASYGMCTHGQRLHECQLFQRKIGWIKLLPRRTDKLRHGAIALQRPP